MPFTVVVNKEYKKMENQWIEIKKKSYAKFQTDKIYINIKHNCSKRNKNSLHVNISIGNDVAELMNVITGDRISIFMNKNNPYHLKLMKSDGSEGYKIYRNQMVNAMTFGFVSPLSLKVKAIDTTEIDFDICDDKSIILDFHSVLERL